MFHHHDRVIDDEPNGSCHATESHDIETHFQRVKKHDRSGEHDRHSHGRDQSDFPIAEKDKQDERGKSDADKHCVAGAVFGCGDQVALIVPVGDLYSFGNLFLDFA